MIQIKKFEVTACATELVEHLKSARSKNSKAGFAIPGGRSPGPLLKEMSQQCEAELYQHLYLYWVDERCVPCAHSDRNDEATLAFWKEGGKLPTHIRSMPAEKKDLAEACVKYSMSLKADGFEDGLDLAILGIGEDGHFASLFPNHPGLQAQEITFHLEDSPKPPPKRLSLSLPYIRKTAKIVVLVMGEAKGEMLKNAVANPGETYPVSLLFDCPQAEFYLDEAAKRAYEL